MEIVNSTLEDCFIIKNKMFGDSRGYFMESFNARSFEETTGVPFEVKQINFAKSQKGVLRGLHYQLNPFAQAKMVGVAFGTVLDVVVDLRRQSKTFGKKYEILLESPDTCFYIPAGFAHGYEVLEDNTLFYYAVDSFYSPSHERGIHHADPELDIQWKNDNNLISGKDSSLPLFKEAEFNF